MSAPTLRTYFAPGHTWTTADASIVWVEITAYVRSNTDVVTVNRGRSSELDDYRAGTGTCVLNNADRRFDPSHAAGPYFGQLLPGVPFKVEAVANSTTFPVFRGFIDGWPQDYDLSNKLGIVNLSVTDGFGKLATAGTPSSTYAMEVAADSPVAWWRMTDGIGDSLLDSVGTYDGVYVERTTDETTKPLNRWDRREVVQFRDGHYATVTDMVAPARPITVEVTVHVPEEFTPSTFDSSLFYKASNGDPGINRLELALALQSAGGWPNYYMMFKHGFGGARVEGPYDLSTPRLFTIVYPAAAFPTMWVDGVSQGAALDAFATNASSGTFLGDVPTGSVGTSAPFSGAFADLLVYADDLADARVEAHYAAFSAPWDGDTPGDRVDRILDLCGWPSDLRDLATGYTLLGPAVLDKKALALLKGYEKAEQGRLFISRDGKVTFLDRYYHHTVTEGTTSQATFSDDGSDNGYSGVAFDFDDRLVYNRVRGSRPGGADVEVYDQTSIDTYGEQVDSDLDGIQVGTDAQVRGACEQRLDRYKEPQLRVRPIEVKLHGLAAAKQASVLALELGYRVTVERTPQGVGSAIDQETIIEGIAHRIRGGEWTTTLTFSPVDTHQYALWGTTDWGDTAGWGY